MSANTNLSLTHLFNNRDAIVESAPWTDDHIQRCLDHAGEYGAMSDQDFASTLDMLRDATDRRGQYGASIEFDTAYALLFDIDAGCCPTTKRNTTPRTRMAARSGERKANTDRAALRARLALQRDIAALTTKLANIPGIPPATGLDTPDNWTEDYAVFTATGKLEQRAYMAGSEFGGVVDALQICGALRMHIPTMLRAAGDALVLAQRRGEAGVVAAAQNLYNLLTANGLDMVCYYHGYGRDKGKPCEMGEYIGCAECWCRQYADAHKVAHPQHRCSDCGMFFDSAYFAATDCPYCDGLEDDDTPPPTDVVVTDKVTVSTVAAPVVANYSDHVVVTLPDNPSTKVLADTAEVKWSYTYQGVARELNVVWAYAKRHLDAAQWQGDANEGRVEVGHYQALVAISLSQTLRTMGYAAPSEFKFTFRSGDDWGQRILDLQAFITDLTSSGQTVGRNSRTVPALLKGDQIRCNVGWLPAGITGGEALTFNTVEDNQ